MLARRTNVSFCDGSVKFVANDIGQVRWFLLHSAADQVNFDPNF